MKLASCLKPCHNHMGPSKMSDMQTNQLQLYGTWRLAMETTANSMSNRNIHWQPRTSTPAFEAERSGQHCVLVQTMIAHSLPILLTILYTSLRSLTDAVPHRSLKNGVVVFKAAVPALLTQIHPQKLCCSQPASLCAQQEKLETCTRHLDECH